jgi:hypothetical protein
MSEPTAGSAIVAFRGKPPKGCGRWGPLLAEFGDLFGLPAGARSFSGQAAGGKFLGVGLGLAFVDMPKAYVRTE